MRIKHASWIALPVAAVVFIGVYLLTGSLLWSPLIAAVGAVGLYFMLDARTQVQVDSDSYADDADAKLRATLDLVRQIERLSRQVTSTAARGSLESACQYVPELLRRVKANSPNSLYSSASQLGAHLSSLLGVVTQYLDIQAKPTLYANPEALQKAGEEAFARFSTFAFDSIQLVNQGDLATYRANLETVAPPKLPELT